MNQRFHIWAIALGAWGIFKTLVACTGFTIVQPNETKVVTFLGRYLGTIKRNGWGWTWPLTSREHDLAAHPELRQRGAEGQRRGRQPDRGRGRHRLAGRRHGEGVVRRRGLRGLRPDPDRDGCAAHGEPVSLRPVRARPGVAAVARRRGHRRRCNDELQEHLKVAGVEVLAHAAAPPRVRTRDRVGDAAAPAGRSRRLGPHADRRRRGPHGRGRAHPAVRAAHRASWTRSRRPRWSRTCSSCSAATTTSSPSSTPAACTSRRPSREAMDWPSARASCCGSRRSSTPPSRSGRRTSSAA